MSEKQFSPNEQREQQSGRELPVYTYHWNYSDQRSFEILEKKRKHRNGVLVYAVVMTAVFLACFALLAGMLIWYGEGGVPMLGGEDEGISTIEIAERAYPATVLISATTPTGYGYGTGFFIRENGYIATNYHVVKGATNIVVQLYSGKSVGAELVGSKESADLAVLKIAGNGYPVLTIGDSDTVKVGERAIAVGNPSGTDGAWSTTQGIISAINRQITVTGEGEIGDLTMIQTDAPVNQGNSGGPLCNGRGEVIGIVNRKLSDCEGIGFAIPINGAMEILNAIVEKGNADDVNSSIAKIRPTIGIQASSIQKGDTYSYGGVMHQAEKDGVLVSSVEADGAAKDLLQVCDIIIAMDGKVIADMEAMRNALYTYDVGDRVTITVWRNGESVDVEIVLGGAVS